MRRKIPIINILVLILFSLSLITTTASTITSSDYLYSKVSSEVISEGVTYEVRNHLTKYGFVDIHVLKVDLENEFISLDILRSVENFGKKEKLTDLAASNEGVVGGINGSFFDTSVTYTDIVGPEFEMDFNSLASGYNVAAQGAASLIHKGNALYIDFFGAKIGLSTENDFTLYLSGINRVVDLKYPMIFNSQAGTNTSFIQPIKNMHKVVVDQNYITAIALPGEDVAIPEGGYIIAMPPEIINNSGNFDYLSNLQVGTGVSLAIEPTQSLDEMKLIFSGGGKILDNGVLVAPTTMVVSPNQRHPRSALGITNDGRYLIAMVVDGRGSSIGATHAEMANYLLSYNVSDAMHLDGGGSSDIVATSLGTTDLKVLNKPSDGVERKIVNGLGFVSNAPLTQDITIKVIPEKRKMFLGDTINFSVLAYDSHYNPVEIDPKEVYFLSQGITGVWNGFAFTPSSAATGKITAYYGNSEHSVNISSYNTLYDIDAQPSILSLNPGETGQFTITGTSIKGFQDVVPSSLVSYKIASPDIGEMINGVFVPSGKEGSTKVTITAGSRSVTTYVTVGGEQIDLLDFELATDFSSDLNLKMLPIYMVDGTLIDREIDKNSQVYLFNNVVQSNEYSNTGIGNLAYNYYFDPVDDFQDQVIINLNNVRITGVVTYLDMMIKGNTLDFTLSLRIKDHNNVITDLPLYLTEEYPDFTNYNSYRADMVEAQYPIQIVGIYCRYNGTSLGTGTLNFDTLTMKGLYNLSRFSFDYEPVLADPLLGIPTKPDSVLSIFGSTAGRNRLLDEVVLSKVYGEMSKADIAYFAGTSSIDQSKVVAETYVWDNTYKVINLPNIRIIQLATGAGGMLATNPNQWTLFQADLTATYQDNIIVVGNKDPRYDFNNTREGELVHSILKEYVEKTGVKEVFYINASGYDFDLDYYEGIRYITLNGLWYFANDQKVNLNDTFYMVDFYLKDRKLTYNIKNLYPKVEVN